MEDRSPYLVQWFETLTEDSPSDTNTKWSHIEDELNIDFEVMFDDEFHNCDNVEDLAEWVSMTTANASDFCATAFIRWLTNQHLLDCQPDTSLPLETNDFYISFNYTGTLQNTYSIPSQQVFHIHGSLAEYRDLASNEHITAEKTHDIIQFGTSRQDGSILYRSLINSIGEIDSVDETPIADFCDDVKFCAKKIEYNIKKLKKILKACNPVNEIIVMGHSMGPDDMPYFEKVLFPMYSVLTWTFYCHTDEDSEHCKDICAQYNLNDYKIIHW